VLRKKNYSGVKVYADKQVIGNYNNYFGEN